MVMMSPSSGGSRSGGGRVRRRPMSEINVTPMVDVMLVLLIVFMVTAPLLTVGVPVDLPKTAANQIGGQDEPLVVTINKNGDIFLQDSKLELDQLAPRLLAISKNRQDARIFLRGDQTISYGTIMSVMGKLNGSGFKKVALITESLPSAAGRARRSR